MPWASRSSKVRGPQPDHLRLPAGGAGGGAVDEHLGAAARHLDEVGMRLALDLDAPVDVADPAEHRAVVRRAPLPARDGAQGRFEGVLGLGGGMAQSDHGRLLTARSVGAPKPQALARIRPAAPNPVLRCRSKAEASKGAPGFAREREPPSRPLRGLSGCGGSNGMIVVERAITAPSGFPRSPAGRRASGSAGSATRRICEIRARGAARAGPWPARARPSAGRRRRHRRGRG
ncbi:UNVERIFIED_ORG: hypothetical protein M2438_002728 [Methylobacterium sp. SuP10 SLI 274]|nr:hypothetical protein [Methylobacterium sp. SuP10 SLI 274]